MHVETDRHDESPMPMNRDMDFEIRPKSVPLIASGNLHLSILHTTAASSPKARTHKLPTKILQSEECWASLIRTHEGHLEVIWEPSGNLLDLCLETIWKSFGVVWKSFVPPLGSFGDPFGVLWGSLEIGRR